MQRSQVTNIDAVIAVRMTQMTVVTQLPFDVSTHPDSLFSDPLGAPPAAERILENLLKLALMSFATRGNCLSR
jgi:hypothetical protein